MHKHRSREDQTQPNRYLRAPTTTINAMPRHCNHKTHMTSTPNPQTQTNTAPTGNPAALAATPSPASSPPAPTWGSLQKAVRITDHYRNLVMTETSDKNPYRPGVGVRPLYLAGRDAPLRRFAAMLRAAPEQPANMRVTGLRGVGKTVLLETYAERAQEHDWEPAFME